MAVGIRGTNPVSKYVINKGIANIVETSREYEPEHGEKRQWPLRPIDLEYGQQDSQAIAPRAELGKRTFGPRKIRRIDFGDRQFSSSAWIVSSVSISKPPIMPETTLQTGGENLEPDNMSCRPVPNTCDKSSQYPIAKLIAAPVCEILSRHTRPDDDIKSAFANAAIRRGALAAS